MIKSILLAVDGSVYSESVLKYGIGLSKAFEAKLRVITVVDIRYFDWTVSIGMDGLAPIMPSPAYQQESKRIIDEKAEEVLKKCNEVLTEENANFEMEKVEGLPIETICEKSHLADLVVMGPRGEFAKWGGIMMGTTLEAVTRQCNKPIFITTLDYNQLKKILIAYDGSNNSSKALQMAGYFGLNLKLPITLLTVGSDLSIGEQILKEGLDYLSNYNVQVETKFISGDPVNQICSFSELGDYSLLIMGAYGHSRIREAILGSNTVQVMRKIKIPLLLAK
jgi:nucleotide-binding universal stress UspA family protein